MQAGRRRQVEAGRKKRQAGRHKGIEAGSRKQADGQEEARRRR
jgi:hypothetical protein